MLDANLTIVGASTSPQYNLVSQVGQASLRVQTDSTLDKPITLGIKHNVTGKALTVTDRHLVSFSDTPVTDGVPPMIINLTMAVPREGSYAATDIADYILQAFNLLMGTAVDGADVNLAVLNKVLRGES